MTTTIVIQDREEQAGQDAMGNIRTAEMNTGIEGREGRTETGRAYMFWDIDHCNPHIHEEPREPSRKGYISAEMGHTRHQGRPRK